MRTASWVGRGVVAVAVLGVAGGVAVAASGHAATSSTVLARYTTHGVYLWQVPAGVTSVTVNLFGASGGNVLANDHGMVTVVSTGGAGGQAKARFKVRAGEVFEIHVGGQGGIGNEGSGSGGTPGYNGGGWGDRGLGGGGGGGASDIRVPAFHDGCNGDCPLHDRIIVAGGGGGGSWFASASGDNGGQGGGDTGYPLDIGGTQDSGGASNGSGTDGSFGQGCDAYNDTKFGGGGGGLFGGACSAGGSGYISGIATNPSFPTGSNTGDGRVVISTP